MLLSKGQLYKVVEPGRVKYAYVEKIPIIEEKCEGIRTDSTSFFYGQAIYRSLLDEPKAYDFILKGTVSWVDTHGINRTSELYGDSYPFVMRIFELIGIDVNDIPYFSNSPAEYRKRTNLRGIGSCPTIRRNRLTVG